MPIVLPYIFTFFYGIALSFGFFDSPSSYHYLKLIVILPLVIFSIYYTTWAYNRDPDLIFKKIGVGFLAIVTVKTVFQYITEGRFDTFPIDVLLLVVSAFLYRFRDVAIYGFGIILLNLFHKYFVIKTIHPPEVIYQSIIILSAAVIVNKLFVSERMARVRAEGLLGSIETLAASISNGHETKGSDLAISKEEKDKLFLDSANKLNNSISKTMKIVSEITGGHSCCLFISENQGFKLCAAISPSKNLIYSIPKVKGKNLFTWIEEHNRPLRLDKINDYTSLGYYSADDGINAFLGVPVTDTNDQVKGILCVDRFKGAFTREEENLLILAANVAAEFLKSSTLLSRMSIEAREFYAFYRLTKMLGTTLKLDEILDNTIDFSKRIADYDLAAFILRDDDNGTLRCAAADGFGATVLMGKREVMDKELIEWVMEKGMVFQYPVRKNDKKALLNIPPPLDMMGSFLCVPLIVMNQVIGIFLTARRKENPFSPYEIKIFETMSAHVSVAVSNALMYRKMEELAVRDGLTGLYNHRFFQERLSNELERAERYGKKTALLLLDVDFFKKINDTYGHQAGDRILKGVANVINSCIRGIDFAARYGGEEFAAILVNIDSKNAYEIAERIRATIWNTNFEIGDNQTIQVTLSIGVSSFPADADNQRLLISRADIALYEAKNNGRNRVCIHNAGNTSLL